MIFGFILKLETLSFKSCVENNGAKDEFFILRIEKPLALNFCGLKSRCRNVMELKKNH